MKAGDRPRRRFDPGLSPAAGIGLRTPHVARVLHERPPIAWLEVHSENYFADHGPAIVSLERVRSIYPLSLHGVGLSLGSADPIDFGHLRKLKRLIERVEPALVSEHVCWSGVNGRHFNDLLPLPYTSEALDHLCHRVSQVQDALGRRILVENISAYFAFPESNIPEHEFLAALAERSGCGLLVDVNNIYVNSLNHGVDALAFIAAIAPDTVGELHLAGCDTSGEVAIDTHGAPVRPEVWSLYEAALDHFGPVPTLIEWDTDIPALEVLLDEAARAQSRLDSRDALAA